MSGGNPKEIHDQRQGMSLKKAKSSKDKGETKGTNVHLLYDFLSPQTKLHIIFSLHLGLCHIIQTFLS